MRIRVHTPVLMTAGALLTLAGCSSDGLAPAGEPQVTLSFAMTDPVATAARIPLTDGAGRTLEIARVQLLLREVELEREDDDDCVEEDDDCEKFEIGPVLIDLPLDAGVITPFTEAIRPGVYDELEIRIKEPRDDNGERARFQRENPEWPRKATVRVRGTFDAADGAGARPFDVFLRVEADLERELVPLLVVDADTDPGSLNVTVGVRLSDWFRTADGRLVDPARLERDSDLARRIAENIERSIEAFEDGDRDGRRGRGRGRSG